MSIASTKAKFDQSTFSGLGYSAKQGTQVVLYPPLANEVNEPGARSES